MSRLITLTLALSLAGAVTLSAQKGKKAKGNGKPQETHVTVVFDDAHREAARTYFVKTHGQGNCPPGLAKKGNGCLPPGQAKKRYLVGQRLPDGIGFAPLPAGLAASIGPAPEGYRYGMVDGDLLKLAVGTRLVIDVIEGWVR